MENLAEKVISCCCNADGPDFELLSKKGDLKVGNEEFAVMVCEQKGERLEPHFHLASENHHFLISLLRENNLALIKGEPKDFQHVMHALQEWFEKQHHIAKPLTNRVFIEAIWDAYNPQQKIHS